MLILLFCLFCHSFGVEGVICHNGLFLLFAHIINVLEDFFLLHLLVELLLVTDLLSLHVVLSFLSLSSVDLSLMGYQSFPFIYNSIVIVWIVLFPFLKNLLYMVFLLIIVSFPAIGSEL